MSRSLNRFLCCVLAVAIVLDPIALQYRQAQAQQAAAGEAEQEAPKPPTPEELEQAADELEKWFSALEEAAGELPRETFDPKAIVDKMGREPDALFQWVRDNTYLVPYAGSLRGYQGVLMDRVGNSLDRALLLSELLRLAGHHVRLVRGDLTPGEARSLLEKARPFPEGGIRAYEQPKPEELEKKLNEYADRHEFDAAEAIKQLQVTTQRAQRLAEDAVQRTAEQSRMLMDLVDVPDTKADPLPSAASLESHWWVQRRDGSKWIDLDPSLANMQPGQTMTKPRQQVRQAKPDTPLQNGLPAKYRHLIQISVIIERWENGGLEETPVLTHTISPAQLIGQSLHLEHYPVTGREETLDRLLKAENPLKHLENNLLTQTEWLPMLVVGPTAIYDKGFSATGKTFQGKFSGIGAELTFLRHQRAVAGLFDRAGDAIAKATDPERATIEPTHLTAEWIEYTIRTPGKGDEKIRRQIFDLIGPAARAKSKADGFTLSEIERLNRALALRGRTDVLPLTCQISPEFMMHQCWARVLANRRGIVRLLRNLASSLRNPDGNGSDVPIDELATLPAAQPRLLPLAMARYAWAVRRGDVYLDQLNLLTHHEYAAKRKEDGQVILREAYDIVANDVAVHAHAHSNPFVARLEQGVLDTVAEALVGPRGESIIESTAAFFATAGIGERQWLRIESRDDSRWKQLDLPSNALARIEAELAAGYIVVAPTTAFEVNGESRVAWWRVDPNTGTTLGIGESGWGSFSLEYAIVLKVLTRVYYCFIVLKCADVVLDLGGKRHGMRYLAPAALCTLALAGFALDGVVKLAVFTPLGGFLSMDLATGVALVHGAHAVVNLAKVLGGIGGGVDWLWSKVDS